MKYSFLVGLVGAVGLAAACGGNDSHPQTIDGSSGTGNSAGRGGKSSTAGSSSKPEAGESQGGAGPIEGDGLTVTISSPTASKDPNVDAVITADDVTATCSVLPTDPDVKVDGSSVKLEVLDAAGMPALGQDNKAIAAVGVPTGTTGEYSAKLPVNTLETGVVSFRCSAASTDKTASGTSTISTFIDRGPTIEAMSPEPNSPHALEGILPVEFTVTPAPLSDDDAGAAVTKVSLWVAGVQIKKTDGLTEDPEHPGTFRAEIDFTNQLLFKEKPPEHTSVRVEAVNSRMPEPVTAVNDYPVIIDGIGPVVTYLEPVDNAAIHKETTVKFTVVDSGAGLDMDTLTVSVTGLSAPFKYDAKDTNRWLPRDGNNFAFRFDPATLKNVISQVTISIRADDLAGNSTDGVTLLLYKDDLPPIIDLDPGLARSQNTQHECTVPFDPLGPRPLNDLAKTSYAVNTFRALVYDTTNLAPGQLISYMAGAKQDSGRLYVQPDPSKDFLIDMTGDGVCDTVAGADKLPYQSLSAVQPKGGATYGNLDAGADTPAAGGTCVVKPAGTPPMNLCMGQVSDMTLVVSHNVLTRGSEPVVYGIGSLKEPECTGSAWDLHDVTSKTEGNATVSLSDTGWICLAAVATDKMGNAGVSRPLRVCMDDPGVPGVPTCMTGAPAPSCTTNCTAPAAMPARIYAN